MLAQARRQFDRHDLMLFDYTAEDLRRMRKKLGLTQTDVAEIFGFHSVTVSQWERGVVTNPIVLQMYGILLERYQARMKGYVPAFRKLGENEFMEETRSGA